MSRLLDRDPLPAMPEPRLVSLGTLPDPAALLAARPDVKAAAARAQAAAARAAALSPLAQLRRGRYRTPTCVVFGDADEIAPYAPAAEFARVMQDQGLRGSLVTVAGARHIFDLDLAPGSDGWARRCRGWQTSSRTRPPTTR